jgi:hypothetical protein
MSLHAHSSLRKTVGGLCHGVPLLWTSNSYRIMPLRAFHYFPSSELCLGLVSCCLLCSQTTSLWPHVSAGPNGIQKVAMSFCATTPASSEPNQRKGDMAMFSSSRKKRYQERNVLLWTCFFPPKLRHARSMLSSPLCSAHKCILNRIEMAQANKNVSLRAGSSFL